MPARPGDDLAVEVEVADQRGRVGGEVQHDRGRRRDRVLGGVRQLAQQVDAGTERHVPDAGTRDDEAVGVDRVAGVRHQDGVARRGDRLRQVGQPFLRAQRHADLGLGVEAHAEAAGVVGRPGAAQAGDAARGRVAVGLRVARRLDQLVDDVGRRRQVRVAHAEVDDVATGGARLRLQLVDLGEDVGRQAPDAVELGIPHHSTLAGTPVRDRREGRRRCGRRWRASVAQAAGRRHRGRAGKRAETCRARHGSVTLAQRFPSVRGGAT